MEITCSMTGIRKLLICLLLRVEIIKGRPHLQPSGKQKSKRPSGGKRSIVKPKSSSPLALGIGQPGAPVRATQSAGLSARSGGELADTRLEPTAEGWVEHTRGAHRPHLATLAPRRVDRLPAVPATLGTARIAESPASAPHLLNCNLHFSRIPRCLLLGPFKMGLTIAAPSVARKPVAGASPGT